MKAKTLSEQLRIKAAMINLGERIQWGSEAALMDEAADRIEALEANNDARSAVQAAPSVAGMGGWRLVPVEPTKEMAEALYFDGITYTHGSDFDDFRKAWPEMLSAAPVPPVRELPSCGNRACESLGEHHPLCGATPQPPAQVDEREARKLPYWEPCNPGCDPEFNGQRSEYCARLCHNAREALSAPSADGRKVESDEVWRLREALAWYAEKVAGCRRVGSIGDQDRQALDLDGGFRAIDALSAQQGEGERG